MFEFHLHDEYLQEYKCIIKKGVVYWIQFISRGAFSSQYCPIHGALCLCFFVNTLTERLNRNENMCLGRFSVMQCLNKKKNYGKHLKRSIYLGIRVCVSFFGFILLFFENAVKTIQTDFSSFKRRLSSFKLHFALRTTTFLYIVKIKNKWNSELWNSLYF